MIRRHLPWAVVLSVMIASRAIAQAGSACHRVVLTPMPRGPEIAMSTVPAAVYDAGAGCIPEWTDSLRSKNPSYAASARNALMLTGGRAAVDALRADAERAPNRAANVSALTAMASTGSPADITFLASHLTAPQPATPATQWAEFMAAATSLGLLRAESARDSLRVALTRSRPSTFDRRAVEVALAALDRPPCADSVSGDPRGLLRIVLGCRPASMWTGTRYDDAASGGVWAFADSAWRLTPRTSADTVGMARVSFTSSVMGADGTHGEVTVSTWCGRLCGEGWTFRLMRVGAVWRIVDAHMVWVS